MPTTEQFKALIRSHLELDDERFLAVALQAAAHAARQGHGNAAEEIKKIVDDARARPGRAPTAADRRRLVAVATPKGDLVGMLSASAPTTRLNEMVLDPAIRGALDRVMLEQRQSEKLRSFGLEPARKLLLVGPPGTGKTMTAAALAGELGLPLYVIVLHAVISKFMGETAAKLGVVFQAIAEVPGVYLFDEFDAIGTERTSGADVGEIRRVLNSFLLFLERDTSRSVIVAATNHAQSLDSALFRRFDAVIEYARPTPELAEQVIRDRLAPFDATGVAWDKIAQSTADLSYAELTAACEGAAKDAVLGDTNVITTGALINALSGRQRARKA